MKHCMACQIKHAGSKLDCIAVSAMLEVPLWLHVTPTCPLYGGIHQAAVILHHVTSHLWGPVSVVPGLPWGNDASSSVCRSI